MKSDIAAGKCDKSGKPIGVNALSAAGATQPFPCPDGSQTSQPTETWCINMIVPAQKTLMVVSWEYALMDPESGLTSCPINCAKDIPLLRHPITAATCKPINLE